jgi:predicted nucleic acid-binding protein
VVILLDQLAADADLPEEPIITTVTLAELSVGPLVTDNESERAVRLARLQVTEATFEPIPFDAPAARAFARVAVELRRSGRRTKARSFDAIIAATALSRNLPIFTANPEDFTGIEGLDVVPIRAH